MIDSPTEPVLYTVTMVGVVLVGTVVVGGLFLLFIAAMDWLEALKRRREARDDHGTHHVH